MLVLPREVGNICVGHLMGVNAPMLVEACEGRRETRVPVWTLPILNEALGMVQAWRSVTESH